MTATVTPLLVIFFLELESERSTARCTCAIDPEATGRSSKDWNTERSDPGGIERACSTVFCVMAHECDGASEWRLESALQSPSANMSLRVDAHCPISVICLSVICCVC